MSTNTTYFRFPGGKLSLNHESVQMLAEDLKSPTANLHLICQMLAEGTKDDFGLLIQGSARLGIKTEIGHRLDNCVRRLCGGRVVQNLITGGGPGLMEVSNRAAKEVGTLSWGVGITLRGEQEMTHFEFQDRHINAGSLEPRLLVMGSLTDAVIFTRPGIGTMYELMWWLQRCQFSENAFNNPYPWNPRVSIGFEMRPRLVCVGSSYDHVMRMLDQMANSYGTIKSEDRTLLNVVKTYEEAEDLIRQHRIDWDARRSQLSLSA